MITWGECGTYLVLLTGLATTAFSLITRYLDWW